MSPSRTKIHGPPLQAQTSTYAPGAGALFRRRPGAGHRLVGGHRDLTIPQHRTSVRAACASGGSARRSRFLRLHLTISAQPLAGGNGGLRREHPRA